jgi:hypothetical protein
MRAGNCSGAAMRAITFTISAAAAMALSACASQPEAPAAPAPVPSAPTPPPAPPPPPPPPQDWRDIALTPGDWSYRAEAAGSVARYGAGATAFALRCNQGARQLVVERTDAPAGTRLVIRTSFGERALAAGSTLPAADPLLDQIVFSRGRFTVSADGLPMLVIPSWPEPARAIEDCRG